MTSAFSFTDRTSPENSAARSRQQKVSPKQILNNAGTHFFRTNVPVPITVRLPSGGTKGSGPFHSQSMEGLYSHYPGVVVMTPATVEDAYTMLIDAVAIDDPVIYCEHK